MTKGIVNSSFGYTGKVSIKKENSSVELWNNGTVALFELIERALSGESIISFIPSFINATYSTTGASGEESNYFKSPIAITARTFVPASQSGTGHCVRFSCVVRNNDTNYVLPTNSIIRLYLIGMDEKTTLAIVNLSASDSSLFNLINPEQRVIIEWEMSVDNQITN